MLTVDEVAEIFTRIWESFGVDVATVGAIIPYAGGVLPVGWIPCDGRSLLRADYAALFGAIGTVWGAVDGSHFNVPDLRGETLVGQGVNPVSGTTFLLGSYLGEEEHTLTTTEIPSHTHTDTGHTHVESAAGPNVTTIGAGAPQPTAVPAVSVTGSGSASLTNTGGDGPHNNMQPYAVVNYAIIS
jgi:microcystin-dependent protein